MIVAVRITGRVGVDPNKKEAMYQLRLRKKFSCVIVKDMNLLEQVKDRVAFGEIDKETFAMLISKRGRKIGNKPIQESADVIIKKLEEGKSLEDLGIKPFFSLHPPRGGFKKSTKVLYPKGVLGDNKEINALLRRMI